MHLSAVGSGELRTGETALWSVRNRPAPPRFIIYDDHNAKGDTLLLHSFG